MKNEVSFEWWCEFCDEYGVIKNINMSNKLKDVWPVHLDGYARTDLCLVRDVGNDDEGLIDRGYAYFNEKENKLESHFDTGQKVPGRYIKELERLTECL